MKNSIPNSCSPVQLRLPVFSNRLPVPGSCPLTSDLCSLAAGSRFLFIAAFLLSASPALGQSTHAFNSGMNCYGVWKLPDTGQTATYTGTFGEDHDYPPPAVQPTYTDNTDGTTTDNVTGLMWVTSGYADTDTSPATPYVTSGLWRKYTWENASFYCERLDSPIHADWRLPNMRELMSIVNYQNSSPAINATYFPGTKTGWYWTSTTYAPDTTLAWYVDFDDAGVFSFDKTYRNYVRCVRGGP